MLVKGDWTVDDAGKIAGKGESLRGGAMVDKGLGFLMCGRGEEKG